LEQAVGGVFPGEVADVEHAAEPLVVGTLEMDVGLEAHDGGVGEGRLVEVIQAVDYAEHLHLLAGLRTGEGEGDVRA
jgi:GTP cyclohydrolase FolE2